MFVLMATLKVINTHALFGQNATDMIIHSRTSFTVLRRSPTKVAQFYWGVLKDRMVCSLSLQHCFVLVLVVLQPVISTAHHVIDIFSNYPNPEEAMNAYKLLLSDRAKFTYENDDGPSSRGIGHMFNWHDYNGYETKRNRFSENEDNTLGTIEAPFSDDLLESEFGVFGDETAPAHSLNAHQSIDNKPPNTSDRFQFDVHNGDISLESEFGQIVSNVHQAKRKPIKASVLKVGKPMSNAQGNPLMDHFDMSPGKLNETNQLRKYLIRMHRKKKTAHSKRKNRKLSSNASYSRPEKNKLTEEQGTGADRSFTTWLTGGGSQEPHVVLHEGQQKFVADTYTAPFETIKNKTKHYANKLLSLFTVVQFSNFRCQATSTSSQYEGTCYLASECSARNGIAMGMCAQGHGVCCVFRGSCGGVGANNCTYFESPGYPNYFPENGGVVTPTMPPPTVSPPPTPDPRYRYMKRQGRQDEESNVLSCIFRVLKSDDSIRQMRIDFIDLELAGPTNGTCTNERLIITGVGLTMGVPVLCGYNTGQHVYIDVSSMSGPLQISVLANMIARKRYKLRICQYSDGCNGLNCLQQYAGRNGVITSFNYEQAATFSRSMPGYLNNLNYAICIRRLPGFCSITYSNIGTDGVVYPFELRNFENGRLTVPAGQAGVGVVNCPDDYIVIDGLRLCGDRLNDGSLIEDFSRNAPVTDTSGGPILIPVRTSASSNARGFKLFYMQNPCESSGGAAGTPDPRI